MADDEDGADATIVGAVGMGVVPAVVVEVAFGDVPDVIATDGARRLPAVVVEDGVAAPKTLSSAALVQGLP